MYKIAQWMQHRDGWTTNTLICSRARTEARTQTRKHKHMRTLMRWLMYHTDITTHDASGFSLQVFSYRLISTYLIFSYLIQTSLLSSILLISCRLNLKIIYLTLSNLFLSFLILNAATYFCENHFRQFLRELREKFQSAQESSHSHKFVNLKNRIIASILVS